MENDSSSLKECMISEDNIFFEEVFPHDNVATRKTDWD